MTNKDVVGPLKVNDRVVTDNAEISDILNTYFSSIFTRENLGVIPNCPDVSRGNSVSYSVITPAKVLKAINSLKPTMSCGPSGYTNKFLKDFTTKHC